MTKPYTAAIEGKARKITGLDADQNYSLDGGEKFRIQTLKGEAFGTLTLKSVLKLTFTDGAWMLNGKNLKSRIIAATMTLAAATIERPESSGKTRKKVDSGKVHTEMRSLRRLYEELDPLSAEDRKKVRGVALFDELREKFEEQTTETVAVTNDGLAALTTATSHPKRLPVPAAWAFRPVLLADYRIINRPQAGDVVPSPRLGQRITLGRFSYMPGFNEVWLDNELFDLRSRRKAKACLQYLVEKKAFDQKTARHLESEIDTFVREQSGSLPKVADIRIQHYFNTAGQRLKKLRDVIKPVGRSARYFLKLT